MEQQCNFDINSPLNISPTGDTEPRFYITSDLTSRFYKPKEDKEIKKISRRVRIPVAYTILELATFLVQPNGYTWCPSIYKGSRSNENWNGQIVFALDFDKGTPLEEILNRFAEFDITPNIVYYTFSDSPGLRKYRLILVVDKGITNKDAAKFIRTGLKNIFPESDQQCDDAARMFFGGTYGEVLSFVPISTEKLIDFVSINLIRKDHNKTRKLVQKEGYLYNIYRNPQKKTQTDTSVCTPHDYTYLNKIKKDKFDFNECIKKVRIFKEFLEGKQLDHSQLFGLATNLIWIKGGEALMKKTMKKFNKSGLTDYSDHKFSILTYVKFRKYFPQYLKSYSPYEDDHQYNNLIDAIREKRGAVDVVYEHPKIELAEGERKFNAMNKDVFESEEKNINLLKSVTAIGKTTQLQDKNNITVAFPTHGLMDEVKPKMRVNYVSTPRIPTFFDTAINKRIDYFYEVGLNDEVHKFLKSMTFEGNGNKYKEDDVILAHDYLTGLNRASQSKLTIMTTHERAMFTQYNHRTIVFDEDPLSSILDIKKLDTSDLMYLNSDVYYNHHAIGDAIRVINETKVGEIRETPYFEIDYENLVNGVLHCDVSSNVLKFFSSTFFMKDPRHPRYIYYITVRNLPTDKKIIIQSATAPVPVYQKLYGDRFKVLDVSNIKNQGRVIQHTKDSFSRVSMARHNTDDFNVWIDGRPVITFKCYSDRLNVTGLDVHYGKCEGVDFLKGKNLVIIGTPHFNNIVYLLYAKAMGINLENKDTKMMYQKIKWNGFRFKFMCYNDPELREIQLSLIESELVQAVGRARTLRTDAIVDVYSNLPLTIADEIIW